MPQSDPPFARLGWELKKSSLGFSLAPAHQTLGGLSLLVDIGIEPIHHLFEFGILGTPTLSGQGLEILLE